MSKPYPTTRDVAPCNGGTERFTACHDRCPKDERGEFGYKAWKANLEKVKEEKRKYAQCRFNLNNHDYYKH